MEELLSSRLATRAEINPAPTGVLKKKDHLFKARKRQWARRKKAAVVHRSMFHYGYRRVASLPLPPDTSLARRPSRTEQIMHKRRQIASSTVSLLGRISKTLPRATTFEGVDVPQTQTLSRSVVLLLAVACGLSSACLIYAQPLLASMAHSFVVPTSQIGLIPMLGQIGYALGLIFIVPLGEILNQRYLIVVMLCAVALALAFMAVAQTISMLVIASGLVGVTSIVPELIIPFAARQVSASERGRIIGTMLCGFLVGTPLANLLSGVLGAYLGWRTVYGLAAVVMIAFAVVFRFMLPNDLYTRRAVSYPQILASLWVLLRSEPVLQEISLLGMLVYGAFTAFWVTLSFILQTPPYHYGSDVAGIFGLVGLAGAVAALLVGKFTDRHDPRSVMVWALVVVLLAFIVMWLTGHTLAGLIFGTLLLDLGVQSHQTANEARIYHLDSSAWNRLNSIYILLFSLGGALGAWLGAMGWSLARENGVYASACLLLVVALGIYLLGSRRASVKFTLQKA